MIQPEINEIRGQHSITKIRYPSNLSKVIASFSKFLRNNFSNNESICFEKTNFSAANENTLQRCPSRLKMRRCRTTVIPRKRISGAAAPHRFSGESVPHRCHPATTKSFPAPLPHRNIFENTCRCRATAAVVTQISHKEAYFYKSEEYVIFSVNNQYLFDY